MGDLCGPFEPVRVSVVIGAHDSELEHLQAFERGAVLVGGELGEAVLAAVESVRQNVMARAS